ncbi:MAG: hypothetical protein IRZ02_01155 [Acidothermus sp.]|nr:hypothetical protein [Acidothermus sp.]MCL6538024.1 CAP domain-containing protein [Acidothermus sp.]
MGPAPGGSRRLAIGALLVAVVSTGILAPRVARADAAGTMAGLINASRADAGLPPLAVRSDLTAVAQAQAQRMAASGTLTHTPNLGSAVCCWRAIGENVGEGQSLAQIHSLLMNSEFHRGNILSTAFTELGVGVARDGRGNLWVSEIFRQPSGVAAPPHSSAPQTPASAPPIRRSRAPTAQQTPSRQTSRPASRSVVRRPLTGFAARLGEVDVSGNDPVSRVLEFAAQAAAL